MNNISSINQMIIKKLTDIICANLENENFVVNELAHAAGMSCTSVNRRLNEALNKSASQFIREVRLQKAMEMLKSDIATAAEISFKVGFNSPSYFNSSFHQYYGFTPGEVKKRNVAISGLVNATKEQEIVHDHDSNLSENFSTPDPPLFSRRNIIEAAAIVGAFLSLTLFWYFLFFKEATMLETPRLVEKDKTLVVLPFKNLSDNPENQYFADGVREDLLNQLFKIKELQIISRTTVDNFRSRDLSARDISKKLGVNFILEGSVRKYDDKVRISVQLIDARLDRHIWSEKYDNQLADIFLIQSTIAKQVAEELQTVLSSSEIEHIDKIPTKNPEAYNLYLKGRYNLTRMTPEGLENSINFFEMALAADPNYALAYSGLSCAYYFQSWWGWTTISHGFVKARDCALKALELDNRLAEAHAILGAILCWKDWNWDEALKEFQHALALNPNNPLAQQYYSEYLDMTGNNTEARKHIILSLKLDPLSAEAYFLSGLYFYHEGKFNDSMENFHKSEQLNGDKLLIYNRYFDVFYWNNNGPKASETLQKILEINSTEKFKIDQINAIYLDSNLNGLLRWLVDNELNKTEPETLSLAKWYARLGNKKEAIKWLRKGFDLHLPGLPKINNDPDFENLRRESGFKEILSKLGLINYSDRTPEQKSKS